MASKAPISLCNRALTSASDFFDHSYFFTRRYVLRLCGRGPPPARPSFMVLCLGLKGSGKSTLLAILSGESTDEIAPTVGFSIKALMFKDCFVDVKELGGGDSVRPYWDKYYQGAQGVIFVVDSTCNEEDMETNKEEFEKAIENEEFIGLPLLVLANHQDKAGARKPEQISEFLDLKRQTDERRWAIHGCSAADKASIQKGFDSLNSFLLESHTTGQGGEKNDGEFHKIS